MSPVGCQPVLPKVTRSCARGYGSRHRRHRNHPAGGSAEGRNGLSTPPYPCLGGVRLPEVINVEVEAEWMRLQQLRTALAEWLPTLNFDYFLTITFEDPVPRHRALTALNTVRGVISRGVEPRHLFLATEAHASGFLHVHGLYARRSSGDSASEPAVLWSRLWRSLGRSRVERIRSGEAVAAYCTKYVLKGLTDYSLS